MSKKIELNETNLRVIFIKLTYHSISRVVEINDSLSVLHIDIKNSKSAGIKNSVVGDNLYPKLD